MSKKKLAVIVPSLRGGGAERVMINIIKGLNRDKFDIRLILIKKEGAYIDLIPEDVSVVDLDADRVRYSFRKLIKALNEYRSDRILSTLGHLNLALLLIRPLIKGKPKIFIREANTPSRSRIMMNSRKRKVFEFLTKRLYPRADIIIAQCEDMKKDIVKTYGIDEKKIKYIYNPLDIDLIHSKMQGDNPYDKSKINLLATGRLTYQKGFDNLINAFKKLEEEIPNARLTILGEGELEEQIKEQIKDLELENHVVLPGFKKNPYPYYYYADTYVLSSRWEGFPNTLLEALACGTKVVATNCKSGPREIIGENEYGILAKENNIEALASGIIESINSENRTRDRAEKFRVDRIIEEYEKILY